MPTDACLFFHECTACRTLLRPKSGDCCVFLLLWQRALPADPKGEKTRRAGTLLLIEAMPFPRTMLHG